ncbi:MAG: PPC domain-containing DNA-binding protein [Candidatus Limnocylindrales bacterium]|jgi:predicted DNA-binding protein with PD1-like motif
MVTTSRSATFVSLRIGPGEDLIARMLDVFDSQNSSGGALVSAAGSLEFLRYAVAVRDAAGIPRYSNILEETGAIEITSLQGHLGREADDAPTLHLHGTFVLEDSTLRAGHVFGARALITVELTLLLADGVRWDRRTIDVGRGHQMPILVPVSNVVPECQARDEPR